MHGPARVMSNINALPVANQYKPRYQDYQATIAIIRTSGIIFNTILGLTMHVVTRTCVAAPGTINILPPLTLTILINL